MLSSRLVCSVRSAAGLVQRRSLGVTAPAFANDPIQQLFLDKIKDYKQKSAGGQMVDPTPEVLKELKTEHEKLQRQYGGGSGIDMTDFPSFKFEEPKLDPIDLPA